jgi:hypothetical protein
MTGWYNVGCLVLLGWTLCFAVHGLGNGLFCGNHSFAGWGRGKPFGGVGQTCALVSLWITLEQRIFQLKNTFCHFAKISGLDTQLTHHTFSFFIFLFFFFSQRIDAQIPVYFSRRVVAHRS